MIGANARLPLVSKLAVHFISHLAKTQPVTTSFKLHLGSGVHCVGGLQMNAAASHTRESGTSPTVAAHSHHFLVYCPSNGRMVWHFFSLCREGTALKIVSAASLQT